MLLVNKDGIIKKTFIILLVLLSFIFIFNLKESYATSLATHRINDDITKTISKAETLEKDVKFMKAEDAEYIHKLQVDKKNLQNSSSLKYDEGEFMLYTGGSTLDISRKLNDKEIQLIEEEIQNVIKTIPVGGSYFDNTKIIASPYGFKGASGFTITRNFNGKLEHIIVISTSPGAYVPYGEFHRNMIKSTILHEIGHVYQNKLLNLKTTDAVLQQCGSEVLNILNSEILSMELNEDASSDLNTTWKNSPKENFAEDFRFYFSDKLGDHAFKPFRKKTNKEFNIILEKGFDKCSNITF